MASGLNGQSFCFNGYLPIEKHVRLQQITTLEKRSIKHNQTQIFIEAPYRNQGLLEHIVQTCQDNTDLCIAAHLTAAGEMIATKTIKEWKQALLPDIHKIPTIFYYKATPIRPHGNHRNTIHKTKRAVPMNFINPDRPISRLINF